MKRSRLFLALLLALTVLVSPSFAAVKAGDKCTKAGSTSTTGGKKFTCVKSGKKLVWNKGEPVKSAPKPELKPALESGKVNPTPLPIPPIPTNNESTPFSPWSTNTSARAINDAAQLNFRTWAAAQNNKSSKHKLEMQENVLDSRKNNFQRVDALGNQLFGQFFSVPSATVVGSSEAWVLEKLNSNGGKYKNCSDNAGNGGLDYCMDGWKTQGYIVTADMGYDATNPGNDGSSLLAHEYFHLVQNQLANLENRGSIKGSYDKDDVYFPAWFIEGSANFVGFSVSALALGGTYWEGRKAMFNYAPPGEAINSHALEDYEIRNGPGNYSPTYPYIVGQLATEYLVASIGFEKTLNIWSNFKDTKEFKKSFELAVGISLEEFYKKFEAVRMILGLPAVTHKLVCLTSYRLSEVPAIAPPCLLNAKPPQNTPTQNPPPPPPASEPPPIDRSSNVDGLGCRNREPDLVNSFGTFVCTELANGNNLWKRKP